MNIFYYPRRSGKTYAIKILLWFIITVNYYNQYRSKQYIVTGNVENLKNLKLYYFKDICQEINKQEE